MAETVHYSPARFAGFHRESLYLDSGEEHAEIREPATQRSRHRASEAVQRNAGCRFFP